MILYYSLAIVSLVHVAYFQDAFYNIDPNEAQSLIGLGKEQYKQINDKVSLPVYGSCWKNAVQNLHEGCRHLNEHIQSSIALRFMDCFLIMSGHEPYACESEVERRSQCLTGMSDRAFNAYTEFYTHTQNICFYLRSQIWREETEHSINRLSRTSAHVTEQLEQAEEMQSTLLKHQRESMSVQLELLDNGISLNELLLASQNSLSDIMTEFRTSTIEQKQMLFDVFERLASLQAWALGEVSWLDSIIFYLTSAIIAYIITATPRTQAARLYIFLTISANLLIERSICAYVLQDTVSELTFLNQNLSWWIWLCRKLLLATCCIILGICFYTYRDYNMVNHQLLVQIQKQNSVIIEQMKTMDLSYSSSPSKNNVLATYQTNYNNNILNSTWRGDATDGTSKEETVTSASKSNSPESVMSPIHHICSQSQLLKSTSPAPSTSSTNSSTSRIIKRGAHRKTVMEIVSPFPRYSLRSLHQPTPNGTTNTSDSSIV